MVEDDIMLAREIAGRVKEYGGSTYYVGGFVRDRLIEKDNKDVDIEIHGIRSALLEEILDSLGERMTMGESFGIYGMKGYSLDIAMPRKEHLRGIGHRDFDILVDPYIGVKNAAKRRDFTINAMMQDVLTGEIIDCFDGEKDLYEGIIRHVNDETFCEDPLRVLRAAQFAARFQFKVADETIALCRTLSLENLAKERIFGELKKALEKSEKPSIFFEVLRSMDQLEQWFPELAALIGVEQSPKYHQEGDVWVHTMMVLDKATAYRKMVENPVAFMFSSLTHDMGKSVCTELSDGELHAHRHEILGLPIAGQFLRRLTNEKEMIRYALNMTELHMRPIMAAENHSSIKASNRMFDLSRDPQALICLSMADGLGKIPQNDTNCYDFLQKRLAIYKEYMSRPYVRGRDLIDAGLKPDVNFSEYLHFAHKLRLAGVSKPDALKHTLAYANQRKKETINSGT